MLNHLDKVSWSIFMSLESFIVTDIIIIRTFSQFWFHSESTAASRIRSKLGMEASQRVNDCLVQRFYFYFFNFSSEYKHNTSSNLPLSTSDFYSLSSPIPILSVDFYFNYQDPSHSSGRSATLQYLHL